MQTYHLFFTGLILPKAYYCGIRVDRNFPEVVNLISIGKVSLEPEKSHSLKKYVIGKLKCYISVVY